MGFVTEESFDHIRVSSVPALYGPYPIGGSGSNLSMWRAGDLYTQKQTFTDPATGKNYNIVGWGGTDQYGNPIPILQDPLSSAGGMFYGRRDPTTGAYAGVESVPLGIGGQVYMPGFGPGAGTGGGTSSPAATTAPPPPKGAGVPPVVILGALAAVGIGAFLAYKKGWIRVGRTR